MKKLLGVSVYAVFALIASASLNAHALTGDLDASWADVEANKFVEIEWPSVVVGNVSTTINNVCSNGMGLRTINPVPACLQTVVVSREVCTVTGEATLCHSVAAGYTPQVSENYREETKCTQMGTASAMTETRQYEVMDCVDADGHDAWTYAPAGQAASGPTCKGGFQSVVREIPLCFDVHVIRAGSNHAEGGSQSVGYKTFVIGRCGY